MKPPSYHTPNAIVKTRGVIVQDGKIFLCRSSNRAIDFLILPGGKLENNETLRECLAREIFEELGVEAQVGPLVYTQEIIGVNLSNFDFWYWIENPEDFGEIDLSKASHGHEHSEVGFFDLEELDDLFKPQSLKKLIEIWKEQGPVFVSQDVAEEN